MTPESILARAQLAAAGRKRDRTARFATGLSIGASMVLLFVVVALVDYWVLLSVPARWLSILTLVALFLTGVVKVAQLGRRKTSLKDAALELEATQPRLGCEVSTAAEYLSGERKITQEYERDLVAALEKKATTTLGQTAVPYERRLYLPAVATGMGVLGLLGFVATFPSAATALNPYLVIEVRRPAEKSSRD